MPFYNLLRGKPYAKRAADRLLQLREYLDQHVPRRTVTKTLLLATWNIRDFDDNKFGHGPRQPESFYYIAEIISRFDLVAVQEVNRDLEALKKVMRILGPNYEYLVTDTTEGSSGNNERMAFVYDAKKILFRNVVGEIVLPKKNLVQDEDQFARTPFYVSFQSGWFKFNLCTVHIYFGTDSGAGLERRIAEIEDVAAFISKRSEKEDGNFILLGDFNIVSPDHRTMKALIDNGFTVPEPLQNIPTNMFGTKTYDQIAFRTREGELTLGDSEPNAGTVKYYDVLYTDEEFEHCRQFFDAAKSGETEESQRQYYTREWRTWQMSDHLPLWVEIKIDFSDKYLKKLADD